jgi:methionyl-tRNA synthetase
MSGKFYVCTSIAYVNSKPHVGYAMELLHADFMARAARLQGKETFFLTGTDEHGLKIAQAAEAEGLENQGFVDKYSAYFRDLAGKLGLSNDDFIRTTDQRHEDFAREMWNKLKEAGDLYKDKYSGWYCVGCEKFILEKELVEGNCAIHLKPPVKVEEENYFFRLSKYADKIRELIKTDELLIVPESRKHEILSFLEEDLRDVSFSRPRESVKWGIPVPGDEEQLMYVWCDALSNYISGIDAEKFWPADVQVIGKDILRFHAVYWIGMLLSAGYKIPKTIFVHGFITSEGVKMSKSLGNVKDPFEYIEKYGRDALRYFLLREIPTLGDGDFSQERFETVYKDELANTFGNLVSRVLAMNKKYFAGAVPGRSDDEGLELKFEEGWQKYLDFLAVYDLKKAIEVAVELGFVANKYVEDSKPWELAKNNPEKLAGVMFNLLEMIRQIGLMLLPIIPDSAEKILQVYQIEADKVKWVELQKWGQLEKGLELGEAGILFPRLES